VHDDSDHLATVSSPSKTFFDNILTLNTFKPKKIILSSKIEFTSKQERNLHPKNNLQDDKHFIKQCRSLFLKPSTFLSTSNNPSLMMKNKPKFDDLPPRQNHEDSSSMTSVSNNPHRLKNVASQME